ncbi:ribonuclease III [Roseofilum casamattae]|uniref:Ribonuclease 3 n=1 Tax=Roseofilum casamattae BLCC-M143 TaxID=3022442 RepID=A0ABT7BTD6_9CYAN|nr:ribonuclease III [Roseofilum casamattae]MDJ1182445.1 ribonuclease III [Roseofilum casamattae BLCC-M143]
MPNSVPEQVGYPRRQRQLQTAILKLGLPETAPVQWKLLDRALTHPSISSTDNYEQLEFIGDAVVRIAASELLMELYPQASVGEFSAIRKILVSDRTLAQLADLYNVEQYLLMDRGTASDKLGRASRLADAFEAILGALYLSTHTLELVRPWLDPHFTRLSTEIRKDPARQDYKSALQEWTQAVHKVLPEYKVVAVKPHGHSDQPFTAQVWVQGEPYGVGKGRSRKAAEQEAAKDALFKIHQYRP